MPDPNQPSTPSPGMSNYDPWAAGPEPPRKRGLPGWAILLIVLLVIVLFLGATCVGGIMYLGTYGLETFVQDGHSVPRYVLEDLREMEVLGPGESVRFFYSDAMFDPRGGCYVLTDQRLVLFNENWEAPLVAIDFDDVAAVDGFWSDHWMTDSTIVVRVDGGASYSFPLSMEGDGDHRFVDALVASSPNAEGPDPAFTDMIEDALNQAAAEASEAINGETEAEPSAAPSP